MKNILITGGAGFIGSHTCLAFLEQGFNIYVADSFVNSSKNVFEKLKNILNASVNFDEDKIKVYEGDIRDSLTQISIFHLSNALKSG